MQRPIMNPAFLTEGSGPQKRKWYDRLKPAWRGLCWSGRLLLADIFGRRLKIEVGTPFHRFVKGLCYRMLFLPLAMALVACVLVYNGTHPAIASTAIDPSCHGLNYDPIEFLGDGGVKLEGWLVPVLDAKRVLAEKNKLLNMLNERHPAVVLIHDIGASRQQMLPLVRPLHEAGYVVLLTTLRGAGPNGGSVGSTFGLNEAGDVKAAVDVLRRTPFVDGRKVALVGVGTGANAAVLTAQKDGAIAALVLDKPCQDFNEVLREHLAPRQHWMRWMNPLCEWTFDVAYSVNASELNLQQNLHTIQGRGAALPMLVFDAPNPTCLKPGKSKNVTDFLDSAFGIKRDQTAAAQ